MLNPRLKENKIKRALVKPLRPAIKFFAPTLYVKLQYQYITHHPLNLRNPVRYTEKLQFLRMFVYPKDPLVIKAAGRAGAREYVKETGYGDHLIRSYGVYDHFRDIDFSKLPNSFVLKCTHGSGFNMIVKDKSQLEVVAAEKKFTKWLKTDYGKKTLELHYSTIKPQIIVEEYIGTPEHLPTEYKIHCFNGVAKNLYVVTGRGEKIRYTNFYVNWTPFPGSQFNGWLSSETPIQKPENWDQMVKMAEDLAKPFPFVRVDLYNVNGKIYFGEMTFTPAKGTLIFDDDRADYEQGTWLDISKYIKK